MLRACGRDIFRGRDIFPEIGGSEIGTGIAPAPAPDQTRVYVYDIAKACWNRDPFMPALNGRFTTQLVADSTANVVFAIDASQHNDLSDDYVLDLNRIHFTPGGAGGAGGATVKTSSGDTKSMPDTKSPAAPDIESGGWQRIRPARRPPLAFTSLSPTVCCAAGSGELTVIGM